LATTVKQQDVPIFLDGLGSVLAFNTVTVHTRVDGELKKVAFQEGQDVKTGELLAQVDPDPYQATLDQALGKKATDEAQLVSAQILFGRDSELLRTKV
jgi:multidrug efflux system membrane fusion protein